MKNAVCLTTVITAGQFERKWYDRFRKVSEKVQLCDKNAQKTARTLSEMWHRLQDWKIGLVFPDNRWIIDCKKCKGIYG